MKLEYRVIEVAEGDEQDCNYCLLDFRAEIDFNLNIATHEIVAHNKEGDGVDIAYICATCKGDLENNILPYCELCGRLKRNRRGCFCELLKDRPSRPVSEDALIARSFSSRLENKTKELEKGLKSAQVEIDTHLEALETAEDWHKRQKQELLDKIKSLEEKIKQLEEENKLLNGQQNGLVAQIEVKETKKWPWLKLRK